MMSSDVFSLGCVCIHLVSPQFPEPSSEKTEDKTTSEMHTVNTTEYDRRRKYLPNFLQIPNLGNLVKRRLENTPKNRPKAGGVTQTILFIFAINTF